MPTLDRASTSTPPSDRPTRAAVMLTLAMMVVPLLTLVVAASGCNRGDAAKVLHEDPAR